MQNERYSMNNYQQNGYQNYNQEYNQFNNTNTPIFTIATNEKIVIPNPNKKFSEFFSILKYFIFPIDVALIIFLFSVCIEFEDFLNLMFRTPLFFCVIALIILTIFCLTQGLRKSLPSPIDLYFYNNCLIIYRPKRYYNKKLTRVEYYQIFYRNIKGISYDIGGTRKIGINGQINTKMFNYNNDGLLPDNPIFNNKSRFHFNIYGNDFMQIVDCLAYYTGAKMIEMDSSDVDIDCD